jgi:hypothetical protein
LTVVALVVLTEAVPGIASYPPNERYCPSGERLRNPSVVEVPLIENLRCPAALLKGIGTLCTNAPFVVYSSMKTGAAAVVREVPVASPTLSVTILPAVKADPFE